MHAFIRNLSFIAAWIHVASPAAAVDDPKGCNAESSPDDGDRVGGVVFAGAGYGSQDDSDAGAYGAAFGLKVGYVPIGRLHVGAQGTFHMGSRFGDEQNRVQLYGLEAGVRLGSERIHFVPYLAGGLAIVESQRNVDPKILAGYVAVGGHTAVVPIEPLIVGVDLRFSLVPSGVEQADNSGSTGTVDVLGLVGVLF